ncbi:RHS repeat-associated core domain-containing protein [Stenotrophomonas pavanii]|uniref:RHS repeat-associated core domain-containing protein n=1 Tax=Stenotrophomonas pavanii TaxID=487698 RepID=UPI001F110046|nr:RHS repeat-associated core domain-containing protein [Stenotrophomonas pavanii]
MTRMTKLMATWVLLAAAPAFSAGAQTVTYLHTDALGSVVAESDAAGNITRRVAHDPYGATIGGAPADGPGYTGHVSDATTGLSYMEQRYYDPELAFFLSVDPIPADPESGANFNRYWYANANPYRFVDPDGRQARERRDWRTIEAKSPASATRLQTSAGSPVSRADMQAQPVASRSPGDYDQRDPTYHEYNLPVSILCIEGPGCSVRELAAMVDVDSAPKWGGTTQGRNILHLNNPIMHRSYFAEDGSFYMVNQTTSAHDFHAGAVVSRLYSEGGTVRLQTSGFGYGNSQFTKMMNYAVGGLYFAAWHVSVVGTAKVQTGQMKAPK